ncbi:UDP-N-acetylglucosamine transferase subunit ALG14 [Venustampulla echinocandica]|uniref:UDP-N-acetylglucosamine transferase subunit ALG14 n=1 Tax=Venustampulla echinocandica TaxID=2656787 RepID=A0A370TQH6_9HELO|nr:UDP-N-acetylglucosamine transferase subunit ALG14 [Venustampulla echinocandica]RDL37786.1 UDP-N-acetylglucosamine transferase subunit ALG14 [Venustampulla echinocandica]
MATISALRLLVAAIVLAITTAFLRLLYIFSTIQPHRNPHVKYPKTTPSHMVIVLGSGGHTAEMMSLMRDVDPRRYKHRTYIVSSGDGFSSSKAFEIEKRIQTKYTATGIRITTSGEDDPVTGVWDIKVVPRARKIHQPLYTAPFSSLWCLVGCLRVLCETARESKVSPGAFPDIILTNGPATAVIVALAAMLLKYIGVAPLWTMKTIYVESWARVKTLSLSGKILLSLRVCDRFIVQWEALSKAINGGTGRKRVEWGGFLVE